MITANSLLRFEEEHGLLGQTSRGLSALTADLRVKVDQVTHLILELLLLSLDLLDDRPLLSLVKFEVARAELASSALSILVLFEIAQPICACFGITPAFEPRSTLAVSTDLLTRNLELGLLLFTYRLSHVNVLA